MCIDARAATNTGRELRLDNGSFTSIPYTISAYNEYVYDVSAKGAFTVRDFEMAGGEYDLVFLTKFPLKTLASGVNTYLDSSGDFFEGIRINGTLNIVPQIEFLTDNTRQGNISIMQSEFVFNGQSIPFQNNVFFQFYYKWDGFPDYDLSHSCYIKTTVHLSEWPVIYDTSGLTTGADGLKSFNNYFKLSLCYSASGFTFLGFQNNSIVNAIKDNTSQVSDKLQQQLEEQKEQTETQKGIFKSIIDFFGSFFQNLINAVVSLFVPSASEMSGLFDQLNQFFSDRFGFLYAPFNYIIKLCNVFTSKTGTTALTFPGFSIMGCEVWPDTSYDIGADPLVGTICGYVRTGTGILLAGYFIMYLQNFFKERFGSG